MNNAMTHRAYRYQELEVEMPVGVKGMGWQFITLGTLVLLGALAYVWLTSQTETLGRDLAELRRGVAVQNSEVENLQVLAERFRGGKYIAAAVRRFGLDLHPAYPGQVRRVRVSGTVEAPSYQDTVAARE